MKVLREDVRPLVWRRELRGVINESLVVSVEAPREWRVVVDVVGIVLDAVPREDLEERV
jgi:hypothetical protein